MKITNENLFESPFLFPASSFQLPLPCLLAYWKLIAKFFLPTEIQVLQTQRHRQLFFWFAWPCFDNSRWLDSQVQAKCSGLLFAKTKKKKNIKIKKKQRKNSTDFWPNDNKSEANPSEQANKQYGGIFKPKEKSSQLINKVN